MAYAAGQIVRTGDIIALLPQAGTISVPIIGADNASATVEFPRPFALAPVVVCQIVAGAGSTSGATVRVLGAPSTIGFTLNVKLAAQATVTPIVHWIATLPTT